MARMHTERLDLDPQTVARVDGMWTAMARYERGELSLERLCWVLLQQLVPVAQEAWASALTDRWWALEAINDRVLAEPPHQPSAEDDGEVTRILAELRTLLVEG